MALDIVPVLDFRGDAASSYTALSTWGTPVAGGIEYVEEHSPAGRFCSELTKAGSPCQGHASEDGLCAGHRRQARARG